MRIKEKVYKHLHSLVDVNKHLIRTCEGIIPIS